MRRKKIRRLCAIIYASIIVTLVFSACSIFLNESDAGTVAITIGGGNGRTTAPDWLGSLELEELVHTVRIFDANGVEKHSVKNLSYGETRSFSFDPGLYMFEVEAFYNSELVATGSTERLIRSGANPAVIIQMRALPDLEGDVSIVDSDGSLIEVPVLTGTDIFAKYSGNESGVSFQWKKDNDAIPGATGAAYTSTAAGEYAVTVKAPGFAGKTSEAVSVYAIDSLNGNLTILHNDIAITAPVLTGTELTARYSGDESGVTLQWNRNDAAIIGATGETYTPMEAGEYTVTVSLAGYNSVTSDPVTVYAIYDLSGTVTISPTGSVQIGATLTAIYSENENGVSYQWYKDQSAIANATGETYTPTEVGEYTVTVSLAGYNSKTSDSVIVTFNPFTGIDQIAAYLDTQSGGASVDDLILLPISMELSSDNWIAILNAIGNSGKYVNLDLSACTRSINAASGGMNEDGVFEPRAAATDGMDNIVSLILPETADSIAAGETNNSSFNSFTNLRHVNTGNGITTIGDYGFYCNQLTSVVIGNNVENIRNYAFSGNEITGIIIPDSVKTIGSAAFWSNQLTSITIGDNVENIGPSAFRDNRLIDVIIPDNVEIIGAQAFANNQLVSVTIGNNVETIGGEAFQQNQLNSVTIGNSVKTIGMGAFSYNQLINIDIPDSVETIWDNAFSNNRLTSVIIPNNVTIIFDAAFSDNQLTSVIIGNRVEIIDQGAFYNNQLTNIIIGADVFCNSAFDMGFENYYEANGKLAGTYTYDDNTSSWLYNGSSIPVSSPIKITVIGKEEIIITITQTFYDSTDNEITTNYLSKSGGGFVSLTIDENFEKYEWYVGGNPINGKTINLPADDSRFVLGYNLITPVIYIGDEPYSGEITLFVGD